MRGTSVCSVYSLTSSPLLSHKQKVTTIMTGPAEVLDYRPSLSSSPVGYFTNDVD